MISAQALQHYETLANQHNLSFARHDSSAVDTNLLDKKDRSHYMKLQAIPVQETGSTLSIATSNPDAKNQQRIVDFFSKQSRKKVQLVVTPLEDICEIVGQHFKETYIHDIALKDSPISPNMSARFIPCLWQKLFLAFLIAALVIGFIFNAMTTLLWINIILTVGITISWGFKFVLSVLFCFIHKKYPKTPPETKNKDLPIYTVLIPLFHETEIIIHQLVGALKALDYPTDKLDIKLLLEKEDTITPPIIEKLNLPAHFHVLYAPEGQPRTKPRACNYGLEFAVGKYLAIYDAEDIPEPDQLKKVFQCFKESDNKVVCIQAALNFYNAKENILTRWFTIEYTAWFDQFIHTLGSLKLLLPLGGTSNHFKVPQLKEMCGWDAFTRTEDSELGTRISRHGYRVSTVDSTTFEEAASTLKNWFKQRAAWNKGYLQTYFTHMQNPFKLLSQVGWKNFFSFQLFIGGNIFAFIANLWLWIFFIFVMFVFPFEHTTPLYPAGLWHLAWINFIAGNILFMLAHFIGIWRRRLFYLYLYTPFLFFYWILYSLAGYFSIYELMVRPSYWYRTEHGVGKHFKKQK